MNARQDTQRKGRMKSLSPFIYITRNPGKTLPIIVIILLAVLLVSGIVAILESVGTTIRTVYGYNRYFAAIMPRDTQIIEPELIQKVERAPNLGEIYTVRLRMMMVKTIVGKMPFPVMGMNLNDGNAMISRMGLKLKEGKMPADGEPEIVVSEPIARNLKLKLGDIMLSPDMEDSYSPVPVKLVGILGGEEWFALTSYNFIINNFIIFSFDNLMLVSKDPKAQGELDSWLVKEFKNTRVRLWVFEEIETEIDDAFKTLYLIVNICTSVLALVIAIMMGLLANIYFTQRVIEFGLLQAIGFTRRSLLIRVTLETAIMIFTGWLLGMILSHFALKLLDFYVMFPRGMIIDPFASKAYTYTLPIPFCVVIFAFVTIWWRLRRFDPVAIVERRLV